MRAAASLVGAMLCAACAHQSQPPEPAKSVPSSAREPVAASRAPLTVSESVPGTSVPAASASVPPPARRGPPAIAADASLGTLDTAEVPADQAVPESAATLVPASVPEPEAILVTGPPPPPPPKLSKSELDLRERVQRALLEDKRLSYTAKRAQVDIENNDVTLRGEVRTAYEKSEVEAVIQRVSGVRRVKNQLAVIDQSRAPARTAPALVP